MSDPMVVVPYALEPRDLSVVELAVVPGARAPREGEWRPALRDVVDGKQVVWVRSPLAAQLPSFVVWLRDAAGMRRVRPIQRRIT